MSFTEEKDSTAWKPIESKDVETNKNRMFSYFSCGMLVVYKH